MFKYGQKEEEKPRLIEEYITYFKNNDNSNSKELVRKQMFGKGRTMARSHSQDPSCFSSHKRRQSDRQE